MATCKRVPLRPTTMEAIAMTIGPVRNLMAIEKAATRFPHAMILGCKAMNKPVKLISLFIYIYIYISHSYIPKGVCIYY
jgi:hypothetical protein